MNVISETYTLEGEHTYNGDLHRYVVEPESSACGAKLKLGLVFNHGQGDFGERYLDIAKKFAENGIRVVMHDLPGHGKSSGKRGFIPSLYIAEEIFRTSVTRLNTEKYGYAGHSMGAMLTTYYIIEASKGKFPLPEFCWLSSPLIRPANGRSWWFIKAMTILSRLSPGHIINTSITTDMCKANVPEESHDRENLNHTHEIETSPTDTPTTSNQKSKQDHPNDPKTTYTLLKKEQGHKLINLGWAMKLMFLQKHIAKHLNEISPNIRLLITQGSIDPVCPIEFAQDQFNKFPTSNKQFKVLEGLLHEPFADERSHLLHHELDKFIESIV